MAKIKKKGTTGQAKNFITRTQAVRKLQISLPDFRRLCIFKGIYPREPRNKRKVFKSSTPSTTFYYTKDIQYLLHEPILNKFRDHKALSKKIGRALGRGDVGDASRLEKTHTPRITLDHIIKERYPTFVDALRDLDDALSMLFLFANLPSTASVPPKTIALCKRLCLEFEHYLIITHSLRKSFLSIKGIYYQATIQGQDILWLVPYQFVQHVPEDVDFRIMATFVEFYTTLLGFVNFRLYTSIGLVCPPKFNAASDDQGGELGAFTLEGRRLDSITRLPEDPPTGDEAVNGTTEASASAQAAADRLASVTEPVNEPEPTTQLDGEEVNEAMDAFEPTDQSADKLAQPQFLDNQDAATLFAPFTFYLSRETPRQPLEFLLKAFGCKRVGWDAVLGDGAFTTDEADSRITHQVVDRPPLGPDALPAVPESKTPDSNKDGARPQSKNATFPHSKVLGRTYIQPQWVWDCINEGKLLRPDLYAPGAILPPHLSPWVKPTKGQYDPKAPLAEQEREGEAEMAEEALRNEEEADSEAEIDDEEMEDASVKEHVNGADPRNSTTANDAADTEESDASQADEADNDEWGGFDASEEEPDEEETQRRQHQAELEAEASGHPFASADAATGKPRSNKASEAGEAKRKALARKRKEEEDELERQKVMMSRKKRKALDKMLFSNRKKDEEAERLRAKRRRIERGLQQTV